MKTKLKKIVNHYGFSNQLQMLVEEMAELTQAICKYKRYNDATNRIAVIENLIEEMADVEVVLTQVKMIVGNDDVEKRIAEKVERQLERIKQEEEEWMESK